MGFLDRRLGEEEQLGQHGHGSCQREAAAHGLPFMLQDAVMELKVAQVVPAHLEKSADS
jgi:hypothetical protein